MKRTYDIGHGVTIEDDGFQLIAKVQTGIASTSIGIKRPPKLGATVVIQYSAGGEVYYVNAVTDLTSGWLSVKTFPTMEDAQAKQTPGIWGKPCYQITHKDGRKWWRQSYPFNGWSIKSGKGEEVEIEKSELAQDYLCIQQGIDREQEKRFNEVIAPSGRTLGWIMNKIGEWVAPTEIPVVSLAD